MYFNENKFTNKIVLIIVTFASFFKRIIMETTRQTKVSKLILKELSVFFQRNGSLFGNGMISVTVVRISPDLGLAKVYLSIFPDKSKDEVFKNINNENKKIRYELGKKIKNQLKKIPELNFYIDDSLEYAERIDKLLEK